MKKINKLLSNYNKNKINFIVVILLLISFISGKGCKNIKR